MHSNNSHRLLKGRVVGIVIGSVCLSKCKTKTKKLHWLWVIFSYKVGSIRGFVPLKHHSDQDQVFRNFLLLFSEILYTYCMHKVTAQKILYQRSRFIYLLFYVAFNSQGHIATGSLQVEETSPYCTVSHRASASNCQLSNMKCPARDSNRRPQRLEARTLTATLPSPLPKL